METRQFLAWLLGLFLVSVAVLIAALILLFYNVRSNWPGWPRVMISIALLLVYGAWLLWTLGFDR
jgi:Na+/phosphate symporter